MKAEDFAPVPPPVLDAVQIMKNGTALPNKSGIYFIWDGTVVAYVGQSINLAKRLSNHPKLQRSDKISYLCIDISELFYHEAFYIGICRPTRNGGSKTGTRKRGPQKQKHTTTGYTIKGTKQYGDGRWGFDYYSSGKRIMVRANTKEKAVHRAEEIALELKVSQIGLSPVTPAVMAEFREWKADRQKMYRT